MKSFTAKELHQRSAEILEETRYDVVVITNHNKPRAALLSWESYQALLDTFDALVNPYLEEALRLGINQFYEGKLIPWEETRQKLGLE